MNTPTTNTTNRTEGTTLRPLIDIHETGEALILVADLPGVTEDTVELSLEEDVLTLRARAAHPVGEGWQPWRAEFEPATYERRLRLAVEVEPDGITAAMEGGRLRVTLPKKTSRASRIEVRRA